MSQMSELEDLGEREVQTSPWSTATDIILLEIFSYLSPRSLMTVSYVCKSWNKVSYDNILWKQIFYRNIKKQVPICPGAESWYCEYKRLSYNVPTVCTDIIRVHSDQVLHVSCSHDGTMFATCSKDGFIKVWSLDKEITYMYGKDMRSFSWNLTQFSEFNKTDTLLLVSGVHFGFTNTTSGEIAVFSLTDGFSLECRVPNKPYDIFGTWISERYLLSGDLHCISNLISTTGLWISKAYQEVESEQTPIRCLQYKFHNVNASSIRKVMIAQTNYSQNRSEGSEEELGVSSDKMDSDCSSIKIESGCSSYMTDLGSSIKIDSGCSSYTTESGCSSGAMDNTECFNKSKLSCDKNNFSEPSVDVEGSSKTDETDRLYPGIEENSNLSDNSELSEEDDLSKEPEKLLIFITGSKTYTPHQVGFKRVKNVKFPKKIITLTIEERMLERYLNQSSNHSGNRFEKYDKADHYIDLNGHIIGAALSPDHRYLFVNCRAWPEGCRITHPLYPPPISSQIDIRVIDLLTLQLTDKIFTSHKAYTCCTECFFIFLDVSQQYVASGAEDKYGYVWDRHYETCLAKYPHNDVVNCVSFCKTDSNVLITVSDDNTIKVWRSRNYIDNSGVNYTCHQAAHSQVPL